MLDAFQNYSLKKESKAQLFLQHGLSFLGLLVIFAIEPFYRQPLLDVSQTMMRSIQGSETEFGRVFFTWVSTIGLGIPYVANLFFHLLCDSLRGQSFYHLLFLCTCIFMMSVTKMAYAEPRMFWWVKDITPDECTAEYGNPSGHTELAIAYPMLWYLDIFETRKKNEQLEGKMTPGQIIAFIAVFLYSFLVGFARLYVRVHSWNQIVFGWQLGIWLAFYFHFCLRDKLIAHIDFITASAKMMNDKRQRLIIWATVIWLSTIAILVGTYYASTVFSPPNPAWTAMIEEKCPSKRIAEKAFYADNSIRMAGPSLIPFGAYLGIIMHRQKVGRTWPDMLSTSIGAGLGRLFIQALIPIPFVAPLLLIPQNINIWI
jgi:membrane-associated phospholipid phosphatase